MLSKALLTNAFSKTILFPGMGNLVNLGNIAFEQLANSIRNLPGCTLRQAPLERQQNQVLVLTGPSGIYEVENKLLPNITTVVIIDLNL